MTALVDRTGLRYGRLLVLNREPNNCHRHTMWRCHCDCGNEVVVTNNGLRSKKTQSCGCRSKERTSQARLHDITGKRFGRLIVLKRSGSRHGEAGWLCQCDCGNEKIIPGYTLKHGKTRSCGCLATELLGKFAPTVRKCKTGTTSRFKGVHFVPKYKNWRAAIQPNYQTIHLGTFTDEVEAAMAYDHAAVMLWGDRAMTNAKMGLLVDQRKRMKKFFLAK